jgi:two-component system response regulator AtoC
MQRLHSLIERVAPGKIPVLLLGETGVGKEVFAETLHRLSPRATKPLLRLNCVAFSETLLESELFGHEKGAFTGAAQAKPGLLEDADGGTVFIDEVGELPGAIQVKLLRVIEDHEVMRIGSLKPRKLDVRFVAATNRNLEAEIAAGRFRQDLFFRLNGMTLVIPPLRERASEIEPLARAFLKRATREAGLQTEPGLSAEALALLRSYSWPGNIRELRNVIERAVLLCAGSCIGPEHLPTDKMSATFVPSPNVPPASPADLRMTLRSIEREQILDALAKCKGNQSQAAKLLGISRSTIIARIEQYGIGRPRRRRAG